MLWVGPLWIGTLAGRHLGDAAAWVSLALALILVWPAARTRGWSGAALLIAALTLAAVARGGAGEARLTSAAAWLPAQAAPRWLVGRVVDHPSRESGEPLAVVQVECRGAPVPAGARVRVRLPVGTDLEWGDRVELLVALARPPSVRNPGGGSARAAAGAIGIVAQGRALVARRGPTVGWHGWPHATSVRWRRAIERCFARELTPQARELVTPLVVGDRSGLTPELGVELQAAGLTHLLALSGLHVTWLAGVARGASALAGAGPRSRALAGAACAVFYAALAGPLPSLMRAVATELLTAAARLLDRALDPLQALALSAIALLAVAPGWAEDLGFQLSCAATLGLVVLGGWWKETSGRNPSRLVAALAAPAVPTATAQVTSLPILIGRFHALPWTTLAANLIAVPVGGLLLAAAWLGVFLEGAIPGVGRWAFGACEVLAQALRTIAGTAARAPLALLPTGSEPAIACLAAAGALLLVLSASAPRDIDHRATPWSRPRVAAGWFGGLATVLSLGLAVTACPLTPPPGSWWLVVLDVGQGDALALGLPSGWWLVDAGPRSTWHDAGAQVVVPFLRWAGIRRLEGLVLTHDHADHTGGAWAVLRSLPVRRRFAPPALPGLAGPGRRFAARAAERRDTLAVAPRWIVRWPPPDTGLANPNVASLVLEGGSGLGRALLAADVDSVVEQWLEVDSEVAVLKVAHHGAGSSSGAGFLARLRPRHAVISCGRNNPFGHPDAGALDRLRRAGAIVHRTDQMGAAWFELDSSGAKLLDWRAEIPGTRSASPPERARESRPGLAGRLAPPAPRW
ncbi:MAG TPA: DNA internalization-related competence protein ComEC/Rec2 [Candidatus Eisenbacteria bacterium]